MPDPRNVFVVYGRNDALRRAMFSFLRAIGLNPIEWSQATKGTGSAAPYVGNVIESGFKNAKAIVVILSGDDVARLREPFLSTGDDQNERELTPQPRPNVLFEAGRAFGTHPNETVLVEFGKIRPISDLSGIHAIGMDNSIAKRQELAERLRTAGCAVNTEGTDWHHEGDFESVVAVPFQEISQTESTPSKISTDEEAVLLHVGKADGRRITAVDVARSLNLSYQKTNYLLDKLHDLDFLGISIVIGEDVKYYLSSPGRAYLIENGLIN